MTVYRGGLGSDGFSEFFEAVNGYEPFPWQKQLAGEVLQTGNWPALIDVPTGLGKTALIDIAVYVLAASEISAKASGARRRIFFVVDRRLVVDEAYEHAKTLAKTLAAPAASGMVSAVALRLRALRGIDENPFDAEPLSVTRMRGGTSWESAWVDRPDQPAVVVATVDQVGSRLFFRGYGTTDHRKPMDAALVGTDSLILIDEAHLATTLLTTTIAASALDHHAVEVPAPTMVQLSATPVGNSQGAFHFDGPAHLAHPVARERILADKQLVLAETDAKKLPRELASITAALLESRPGARALIVSNTVAGARAAHSALPAELRKRHIQSHKQNDAAVEPELLIGRTRSVDRDDRIRDVLDRFGVGRAHEPDDGADVLVATQTVEVGANLDVDVLVTEAASLSSLVQRIGRLNRLGKSQLRPVVVVVHDGRSDDPIYGLARDRTWQYLLDSVGGVERSFGTDDTEWSSLQAGPLALRALADAAPLDAYAGESPVAPQLFRSTLRSWAQTSPRPDNDTPVAPYLHGLNTDVTSVSLFWRDDLFDGSDGTWRQRLESMPYVSAEAIELPYRAAMAWLSAGTTLPVADVDSDQAAPSDSPADGDTDNEVVVLRRDVWNTISVSRVQPGDIVAVPARRGGLDRFGWNPASVEPVLDVRDLVSATGRRARPALRLDERTCARVLVSKDSAAYAELHDAITKVTAHLAPVVNQDIDNDRSETDDPKADLIDVLRRAQRSGEINRRYQLLIDRLISRPTETVLVDGAAQVILRCSGSSRDGELTDGGATWSSVSTGRVKLDDHHHSVGSRTMSICDALGLAPHLVRLLVCAAEHHDLGKIDVRFQAALLDGDVFAAELRTEPLAKSGIHPLSPKARRARTLSGLPRHSRHEAWSAALAQQMLEARGETSDAVDLVVHLIAAHHGRSRPYLVPVLDRSPRSLRYEDESGTAMVTTTSTASTDMESPERFERLNARYGLWGLALLETIVRSADQTCSREGR